MSRPTFPCGLRFVLLCFALITHVARCADIFVSQNYTSTTCVSGTYQCPDIKSAVQLAEDNDSIFLAKGIYTGSNNLNICVSFVCTFTNVSMIGQGNPEEVVITGTGAVLRYSRGLNISYNSFSYISSLTFDSFEVDTSTRNILASPSVDFGGAGLYITKSRVTLHNVALQNNTALLGGAIAIEDSNVTMTNCKIVRNQATSYGGGVFALTSNLTIYYSIFELNNVTSTAEDVAGSGGALHFTGTQQYAVEIAGCVFQNNTAQRGGGAIFMEPSNLQTGPGYVRVVDSTFADNIIHGLSSCITTSACNSMGGAVYVSSIQSTFEGCSFVRNFAYVTTTSDLGQGGALFLTTVYIYKKISNVLIDNCNFTENAGEGQGGAIYTSNQKFSINYCNFTNNFVVTSDPSFSTSPSQGGAIWVSNGGEQGVIDHSYFAHNMARSGWGGAIYGTGASLLDISDVSFDENHATSSYTNGALGGAIMVTDGVAITLTDTVFKKNFARPNYTTTPLTYSGSGGALYAQSVSVGITNCYFDGNAAFTGQFDAGATGGAILVENCNPMTISHTDFVSNFAAGFFGSASYASAGTGGALYIKFSVANVDNSNFQNNWVSAGGSANSLGGAVAIFFDYSSVEDSTAGVMFNSTHFTNNSAFNELCSVAQAGTAGAVGIVGVASPPVLMSNLTFSGNIAFRPSNNKASSAGGAIAASLSSNMTMTDAVFNNNYAVFGVGNDVASLTSTSDDRNFLTFNRVAFHSDENALRHDLFLIVNRTKELCIILSDLEASFNDAYLKKPLQSSTGLTHQSQEMMRRKIMRGIYGNHGKRRLGALDGKRYEKERLWETVWHKNSYNNHHFHSFADGGDDDDSTSPVSLVNFLPGLAFAAGSATLQDTFFQGKYHIFVGSFLAISLAQSGEASTSLTQLDSRLELLGNALGNGVTLTVLGATCYIDLYNQSDSILLRELNVFNGSLAVSSDVNVSRSSFLYNAILEGLPSRYGYSVVPALNFLQDLLTGYTLAEATNLNQRTIISVIRHHDNITVSNGTSQAVMSVDKCILHVAGSMFIDSPYRGTDIIFNSSDPNVVNRIANCRIELYNNASIVIDSTGSMVLFTSVVVVAQTKRSPTIVNRGRIALRGTSFSIVNGGVVTTATNSLDSVLTVFGTFIQNSTGILDIILNTTFQSQPVVSLVDNAYFGGKINVSFNDDPNLVLYTGNPSTFDIISYLNTTSTPYIPPASIIAPSGLGFSTDLLPSGSAALRTSYKQSLVLQNIACSQVDGNYQSLTTQPPNSLYSCYICLQNSSCAQCGNSMCLEKGSCSAYGGVQYSSSCCSGSCNPPYGSCDGSNGNTEFKCVCSGWFYDGSNCDELSLIAIVIIFTGTFVVSTALLGFFIYRRSATQKQQVLEELREGILRHTESANNEYILNMQQALILNDVFVKFDEIKLESKIGEGSFGIVHKATFRGAQVAVKQMRSMFIELTDKDIEEFRREAYVMSRLRHPNIVLVMGISLMDQEPVSLPKSRTLTSTDDFDTGDKKKDKAPPPKTVCIITEYLEQGSLADILYGPTRLPAEIWTYELILTCALQAARGMLYLHSHQPPICHRDLKSSNLVVDDHWVVKVTDFGMSRIVPEKVQEMDKGIGDDMDRDSLARASIGDFSNQDVGSIMVTNSSSSAVTSKRSGQTNTTTTRQSWGAAPLEMTSNMGTTAWCAPEILTASNKTKYSVKVDVYSFGMVLWELWEKKRPFDELQSRFDIMDAVRAGKRPAISDNCPPAFKALIQRCWHTDPSRRPMFHYIVRYLKDELARVKRQKTLPQSINANVNVNPSSQSRMSSGAFFRPSTNFTSFGGSLSGVSPSANVSIADPAIRNSNPRKEEGRSSHGSSSSASSTPVLTAPIPLVHLGKDTAAIPEEIDDDDSFEDQGKVPQGRTPLVKATFDRSLSYLTESPIPDSPYLASQYEKNQTLLPSQIYSSRNTEGNLGNVARPSLGNNWRDRYVMKFSGWSTAKPDAGLPPSLSVPSNPGVVGSNSPLSPPTISAMHQHPYAAMDGSPNTHTPSQPIPTPSAPSASVDSASSVDMSSIRGEQEPVFKFDPEQGSGYSI